MDNRKTKAHPYHLPARYGMMALIAFYNSMMLAGLFFTFPVWLSAIIASGKRRKTFRQRMGWWTYEWERMRQDSSIEILWVHALSVGEVYAAQPLVNRLQAVSSNRRLVLTVSTLTGFQTASRLFADQRVWLAFFPYDCYWAVRRVVQKIRPAAVILVETDIWPNFLIELGRRRIPAHLVNLRFSPRTWHRYRRFSLLAGPLLNRFDKICVQASADAMRLRDLGVAEDRLCVTGNLKFDHSLERDGDAEPAVIAAQWRKHLCVEAARPVIVAGSTHEGEEKTLLRALPAAEGSDLKPLLILAPRDPRRCVPVIQLCRRQGLTSYCLSGMRPDAQQAATDVIIVDTIGQLKQLYSLADIAFVGGSLEPRGGHNPLEPALFGKPVLFGPHMYDFRQIAEWLLTAGGACQVNNGDQLRSILQQLLADPHRRKRMGKKALSVFRAHQGAVLKTLNRLGLENYIK